MQGVSQVEDLPRAQQKWSCKTCMAQMCVYSVSGLLTKRVDTAATSTAEIVRDQPAEIVRESVSLNLPVPPFAALGNSPPALGVLARAASPLAPPPLVVVPSA